MYCSKSLFSFRYFKKNEQMKLSLTSYLTIYVSQDYISQDYTIILLHFSSLKLSLLRQRYVVEKFIIQ